MIPDAFPQNPVPECQLYSVHQSPSNARVLFFCKMKCRRNVEREAPLLITMVKKRKQKQESKPRRVPYRRNADQGIEGW